MTDLVFAGVFAEYQRILTERKMVQKELECVKLMMKNVEKINWKQNVNVFLQEQTFFATKDKSLFRDDNDEEDYYIMLRTLFAQLKRLKTLDEKMQKLVDEEKILDNKEKKIDERLDKERINLRILQSAHGLYGLQHNTVGGCIAINQNEALQSYEKIGELLKDDPAVTTTIEVVNSLQTLHADKTSPIPFVFLGGSSGMGKTQMAFNLKAKGNVLYLVCGQIGENSKYIYQAFASRSSLAHRCAILDLKLHYSSCSVSDFFSEELFLHGFIDTILNNVPASDNNGYVQIQKIRGCEISNLEHHRSNCIIILDEFNVSGEFDCWNLLRNTFRSLQFRVIAMGTNAKASNLINASKNNNGSEMVYPWCYLISKFPVFPLSLIGPDYQNFVFIDILKYLVQNSRPMFSQFLLDSIDENKNVVTSVTLSSFLDSVCAAVFNKTMAGKRCFVDINGLYGQLCLFLNGAYNATSDDALIHRHFAHLSLDSPLILDNKLVDHNDEIWQPKPRFPSIQADVLLYMCLMGGKNMHCFKDERNIRISVSTVFSKLKCVLNRLKYNLPCSNDYRMSNDGMKQEAILATSICAASHYGGFSGIAFKEFLPQLLYELSFCNIETLDMSIFPNNFNDLVIPFLSPLNHPLPDHLINLNYNYDVKLDSLYRTSNKCQIYLSTGQKIISAECKENEITKVLHGIPDETTFHIVLANKFKKEKYFTKNPYNFENLANCLFYKISSESIISSFGRFPDNSKVLHPKRVILFLENPIN